MYIYIYEHAHMRVYRIIETKGMMWVGVTQYFNDGNLSFLQSAVMKSSFVSTSEVLDATAAFKISLWKIQQLGPHRGYF